jgi:hypothetical protein
MEGKPLSPGIAGFEGILGNSGKLELIKSFISLSLIFPEKIKLTL